MDLSAWGGSDQPTPFASNTSACTAATASQEQNKSRTARRAHYAAASNHERNPMPRVRRIGHGHFANIKNWCPNCGTSHFHGQHRHKRNKKRTNQTNAGPSQAHHPQHADEPAQG